MSEYRVRATGEVKSQGQLRKENPNISLPRVWNSNVCDVLGIDPVLAAPQPAPTGDYKTVYRDGVVQDANGNWVHNYSERDMFAEYTDEDNVVHTKADQETAYQTRLDDEAAERVRSERDRLLAETDWTGLSDVTMSAEMTTYRQALRDITTHANFPHLNEEDWPTAP